jgi:sterol desaturase/sphingolipid hydroxylase (fatty acid hydroxylase superfamily)
MPTPLEILLDPVSLAVLAIYGALILVEAVFPARALPRVPGWHARALVVFAVYFFLSAYLPLLWGDLLAPFRLLNLESLHPLVGAVVGVLFFEFLVYVWHRAMHKHHWLWRAFHQCTTARNGSTASEPSTSARSTSPDSRCSAA